MSLETVAAAVQGINGWLSEREVAFLYHASLTCSRRSGVILEIGSWQGKSTVCLALASAEAGKAPVYAVDPHEGVLEHDLWLSGQSSLDAFLSNIRQNDVNHLVVPVVRRSELLAPEWQLPISLLWIDGDHSYEGAKRDFMLFSPFVVDGGIIAFHDATQGDLPRVIRECLVDPAYAGIGVRDSICYVTKRGGRAKSLKDWVLLAALGRHHLFRRVPGFNRAKAALRAALAKM